jgi:outer membrane porin, OprD family
MMVKDFDRAGEDAWLVGLSYDFNHFSFLDGLSAFTNYGSGYTPGSGSQKLPDQQDWDITVDYRPTKGYLEGLWLRFRRSQVNQGTGFLSNDSVDYRVILNFDIQLL